MIELFTPVTIPPSARGVGAGLPASITIRTTGKISFNRDAINTFFQTGAKTAIFGKLEEDMLFIPSLENGYTLRANKSGILEFSNITLAEKLIAAIPKRLQNQDANCYRIRIAAQPMDIEEPSLPKGTKIFSILTSSAVALLPPAKKTAKS
ncbi:hypothetical protein [Arundinibacter roseus]|uniref:Uncharacterized protein n=1 Tax=Arundinibacter roseus TaxID=2070510 RepID=A0A4R4K9H7_9BACT|nr:hypothetical protein [Arundinibacter roseus]TDB64378.1 hypothetical protein EZE20_11890 [Arundinibacter roseus]